MSDSVQPHRWQPTRLPHPWDSLGKNTGVGCHFLLQCMKVKSESEVAQSCPTLSDPMDCSLPGSSIHGICQARVLEWGAIAFSNFIHSINSLYISIPIFLFIPPHLPLLGVLYICVCFCFVNKIIYTNFFFFRFYIYTFIYNICIYISDLLHIVCMTVFRSKC